MGKHPKQAVLMLASEPEDAELMAGENLSSSDSNDEKSEKRGREKAVRTPLAGDKAGDGIVQRNVQASAGVDARATVLRLPLEWIACFLLGTQVMFLLSKVSAFIRKQSLRIRPISFSKLLRDVASARIFEISQLFVFALIHDNASWRDLQKTLMVVSGLWFLSMACCWAEFFILFYHVIFQLRCIVASYSIRFLRSRTLRAYPLVALSSILRAVLHVFRNIMRAMISSPGFNERLNDFCHFLLGLAESSIPTLQQATSSIPTSQQAMFIAGMRRLILIAIKMQGKKVLVLLLVGSGERFNNAKAFVDLYVTDTV